ncbi:putative reverse transcriptase domain-containing protein [Tanacetum coccineum]
MVDEHHRKVQKASTSKGVESLIYDATRDENENESFSSFEGLNYRGELEEFRKGGIMKDYRNDMTTYHDFMECDVPKFDGALDPIASTRWLIAVEGKVYEKGEECIGACTWKEFKELFHTKFTPTEEIDRIREKFRTLTQTNETVNEMMLRDDIRELISPFKCTTLDDLLSRARVREADLLRKKNKEAKETRRKIDFRDQDAKKPKHEQGRKSGGTQFKSPLKIEEKVEKARISNSKARVYMMATEEDKVKPDIVTCTILVNSKPAHVLYDSGASVSFVSYEFSKNLSTPSNKLHFPLEVEIADDKVVIVSNVYREVEIEIDDSIFRIDLIPIMLGVFNIVFAMEWLDKYNANILCSQKLVRVINPQGREIIIYGDRRVILSTPVCWDELRSRELASTDVVLATTGKIETIRERLKATQDRWKSYADNRRRPIEFNVGDFIMLKVSPWKGVLRFKNKGKLSLRSEFNLPKRTDDNFMKEIKTTSQQDNHVGESGMDA